MFTIWDPDLQSLLQSNYKYNPKKKLSAINRKYVRRMRRLGDGRLVQGYSSSRTSVPKPLLSYLRTQFAENCKLSPQQSHNVTNHQLVLYGLINCVKNSSARKALLSAFCNATMNKIAKSDNKQSRRQSNKQILDNIHDQVSDLRKFVSHDRSSREYSYQHLLNVLYTASVVSAAVLIHFSVFKGTFSYFKRWDQLSTVLNCDSIHKMIDKAYLAGQNEKKRVSEKLNTSSHRNRNNF